MDWMANLIRGKKSIYGKRSPSTARELITQSDLSLCTLTGGAIRLDPLFPGSSLEFTDLAMRSEDLDDLIAGMHWQSGFEE